MSASKLVTLSFDLRMPKVEYTNKIAMSILVNEPDPQILAIGTILSE